jgi:hypothetical protein
MRQASGKQLAAQTEIVAADPGKMSQTRNDRRRAQAAGGAAAQRASCLCVALYDFHVMSMKFIRVSLAHRKLECHDGALHGVPVALIYVEEHIWFAVEAPSRCSDLS